MAVVLQTKLRLFISTALLLAVGCGVRPITGGTEGVLQFGEKVTGEVQVTFHQADGAGWSPIGFGVTNGDGSFALVTNGAQGPLRLPAGVYRCTFESAGAPVNFPPEYSRAEVTPIQIEWSGNGKLHLQLALALP